MLGRCAFFSKAATNGCLWNSIRSQSVAVRDVLQQTSNPQTTGLGNGLTVVSENNGKALATVGVWVDGGVIYENEDNNGVSNFLQRLFYRGTGKRSATQLREDLGKIGARLRSYVERDRTAIYAECASADVEKVVEIIADVIRNSKLDQEAIELERSKILKDLEISEDDSLSAAFDLLHRAAFQGTPLEKPLIGTTSTIKSLNRSTLQNFLAEHYSPSHMVLVGVGGIDHSSLIDLSKKYFGDLRRETRPQVDETGIRFTGSEIRYRDDSLPFMYGAIAVEGLGIGHPDNIPLEIVQTAVGQWDRRVTIPNNSANRLVRKVSKIEDIHYFESFMTNYKNAGLFGIKFVAEGENILFLFEFLRAVQKEWKYMTTSLTHADLDRAKNTYRTNLLTEFESSTLRADYIARHALSSKPILSLAQLEDAIESIDGEVIREAVLRNIYDRDVASAGTGRTEAFPDYLLVRYGMSWWRL